MYGYFKDSNSTYIKIHTQKKGEIMPRNFKKETEWVKNVYKRYVFKCKLNDEVEKMTIVLNGRSFSDWIREHLNNDYKKICKK